MNKIIANRYQLLHKLGEGGMADVYLGSDTILHRDVAVKILRGELATDPIAVLRFKREATAASALTHPNMVEVYDVGEEDGQHYIVMEYIKGKTLKQLIGQRGALDKQEAVYIMKQLLGAMMVAHKNNVVHRDIKPQNILIKDDGTIKLSDFGIALAQNAAQLTQADAVLGSVHYLAPEIARGEPASEQSDIYGLGVVFYELLCGDVPFRADAPVQVALKHMRDELPSIRSFNPTIPQAIENIILKACAKNKNNRYKTVALMAKDLETSLDIKRADEEKLRFEVEESVNDKTIVLSTNPNKKENEKRRKLSLSFERLLGFSIILFSIVALGAVLYLTVGGAFGNKPVPVTIPSDILGVSESLAREILVDLGLQVEVQPNYEYTDTIEKDFVCGIVEGVGNTVNKGTSVKLIISKGKYFVVKDYKGRTLKEVKDEISLQAGEGNQIKVLVHEEATADFDSGVIMEQAGPSIGDKVDPSRYMEIRLTVAVAPEIKMPSVIGWNYEEAVAMLESLGFDVTPIRLDRTNLSEEQLNKIEENKVIDQNPIHDFLTPTGSSVELMFY